MLALVEPALPPAGPRTQPLSAARVDRFARAMRLAFADRAAWLGDPAFFPVPLPGLLDRDYLARRAKGLAAGEALGPVGPGRPPGAEGGAGIPEAGPGEGDQTTHYAVADGRGGCVSVTTTLNSSFGAKVVVAGAGFLLNNEMDDFSVAPGVPNQFGLVGGRANAIAPGKRMLSSMTPTLVRRKGEVVLALGSPGGPRIINTVFQVVVNRVALGMDLRWAINAPRFHQQWRPPVLYLERGRFCPEITEKLTGLGWRLEPIPAVGRCQAIARGAGGWWCACSDLRGPGGALAY
jgi:gamma-glutamyltranspeptidase/glutathione hydrolase